MSEVVVIADAGGTKTEIAVRVDGAEQARIRAPGAALRLGRAMASAASVASGVRSVLAQTGHLRATLLVVGAAGAGREGDAAELARALRAEDVADRVRVMTDVELALDAAFADGKGIILCVGTGSIAATRGEDGKLVRKGGYGWQMGDGGGGYDIGRSALMRVGLSHDGLAKPTALTEQLLRAARVDDFSGLVRWAAAAGPREVASLAKPVLDTAQAGDEAAKAIVAYAADQLAGMTVALARETGLKKVAFSGGLVAPGPMREALRARLLAAGLTPEEREVDVVGELRAES
jgi:N-acetylglucosamine kinase-like BadF-type ATPase